jgi:hypothetical protein
MWLLCVWDGRFHGSIFTGSSLFTLFYRYPRLFLVDIVSFPSFHFRCVVCALSSLLLPSSHCCYSDLARITVSSLGALFSCSCFLFDATGALFQLSSLHSRSHRGFQSCVFDFFIISPVLLRLCRFLPVSHSVPMFRASLSSDPLCLVLCLLHLPLRSLTLFSFPGFRFLRSVLQIRRRWLRLFPSPFFIAFFVFFVFSAVPIFLRCVRCLRLSRLIYFGSPRRLCRTFVLVSVSETRPRLCHRRWVPLPCTSSSRWVCLFFACVGLVHGISRFLHLGGYVFFALRWATETYVFFSVVLNFFIQFFWRRVGTGPHPALFSSFSRRGFDSFCLGFAVGVQRVHLG